MSKIAKTTGNIIGVTLGVVFLTAVAVFIGAFASGWVMNIIQLVGCDFTEIDAKEVLKIVGVVLAPIGAIMGWIG